QDAHDFNHHRGARAVVRRSRSGVPGVEMSADHDDLTVLCSCAGDLANDVHPVDITVRYIGMNEALLADASRAVVERLSLLSSNVGSQGGSCDPTPKNDARGTRAS